MNSHDMLLLKRYKKVCKGNASSSLTLLRLDGRCITSLKSARLGKRMQSSHTLLSPARRAVGVAAVPWLRHHLLPIDQFVANLIPSVYVNNAPLPLPRPHKLARFFPWAAPVV